MIRTKYLFVTILGCLGVILGSGVWSLMGAGETRLVSTLPSQLSAPRDAYEVEPNIGKSPSDDREAFIARVRSALLSETPPALAPVSTEEEITPEVIEEKQAEPTPVASYTEVLILHATGTITTETSTTSDAVEKTESATSTEQ